MTIVLIESDEVHGHNDRRVEDSSSFGSSSFARYDFLPFRRYTDMGRFQRMLECYYFCGEVVRADNEDLL